MVVFYTSVMGSSFGVGLLHGFPEILETWKISASLMTPGKASVPFFLNNFFMVVAVTSCAGGVDNFYSVSSTGSCFLPGSVGAFR